MGKPLNQQVVVISGAASGIGRATAKRFAAHDARVVVGGRSAAGIAAILQEIKEAGGQAVGMEVDVSRRDQVEALAALATKTYGRIDTWVNNAGVSVYGRFETIKEEEVRRLFDVNFMGQMYGMWTALPILRANGGGTIINLASVVGKRGLPLQNFYSATKFAIIGLTEAVRVELKTDKENIALCAICPPSIDTPFYDNALSKMGHTARPLPIVLSADRVAKDVVKCAVRARREVWVGLIGKAFVTLSVLFPWMMDMYITSLGYGAQMSDEPPHDASLFQPTSLIGESGHWSAWGKREQSANQ
ncbi:MAG TPA: SDR family oxidoreductase [Bryobacteraceae bacterium]|nr:SDR family oxidoreductase [Bryobacteraceae bacterium]